MEFFHLIKATQKSGKKDVVIWFTAKSAARANLQLDVALEDAEIETGRGKDYAKPIRTDLPVCNDLPKEGAIDYTWCERYELQDDGRTWLPKAAGTVEATIPDDVNIAADVTTGKETVSLENRTPAVRFAVHLTSSKYQTHITKEQQLDASEMSLDEGNTYLQTLLQAKSETPEVDELSLHAEWKLVQAVKDIFAQGEEHKADVIAAFMSDWAKAETGDRNQLVEDWLNGKFPMIKASFETDAADGTGQVEQGLVIDEHDDEDTHYPVVQMPFRKQLLAQFTADELRHHVTREEFAALGVLEMDTDNSYVQNLLLAAESCPEVKGYDTKDLWRFTDAIRKVFSQDKRHELALVLRFTRIWAATDYINRGILAREWAAGNRISNVQRTDSGTNADGGFITDRGEGAHHTLDTLDLEIACALLPMDFNHREIPGSIHRRAKEIVASKEQPWKSWSTILRNQPGILSVNRAAIFNLVRIAPENIHLTPVAHLEFINQTMTAEFNAATELVTVPAPAAEQHVLQKWVEAGEQKLADEDEAETQNLPKWAGSTASQPQVVNLGGGMFSIDGLMGGNTEPVINNTSNEVEKTETVTETTSNVQMEEAQSEKVEVTNAVSTGESVNAIATQTDAVAETLFTHLMVDLETMGNKPGAPIVSVGAVFFDPSSGTTGAEHYQVIDLESSMSFGAKPDASTILWWLKQSPEARSAIVVDDTVGLVEALEQLLDFIAENAANGSKNVQLWGNGSSFDCSLLEAAFELADTPFPIPHWNYRDVRTVVELGKAVGLNCRYDIPFEGDPHHALADARHQAKYVSAIWQHLTAN